MASDVANGSTVTFASASIGDLQNIDVTIDGSPVDLTDLADTKMVYLNGIPDIEVQITTTGIDSRTTSTAAGTLAVAWFDGNSETLTGNWIITNARHSGGVNTAITSQLTFKPSA
jgi:hypothetical protein